MELVCLLLQEPFDPVKKLEKCDRTPQVCVKKSKSLIEVKPIVLG